MTKYIRRSLNISTELFTVFSMLIIFTVLLSGCSPSNKQEIVKAPAVCDIGTKIKESVDLSEMSEIDSQKMARLYDLSAEDIEEYWIMTPSSNIKAQEIAIIKVKDSAKIEDIVEKLRARVKRQANSFKDYIPEEYFLIQNYVLKSQENYVILIISEETDAVENIFDDFFQ